MVAFFISPLLQRGYTANRGGMMSDPVSGTTDAVAGLMGRQRFWPGRRH